MRLNTVFFSAVGLKNTLSQFANVNDLDLKDYSVHKKTHSMDFLNKIRLIKYYFIILLTRLH